MLALRQAVTRRKLALLIILALLPLGLAVILDSTVAEEGTLIGPVAGRLVISVTLPITVMVLATGAFGNEVEDRTLSLLTTKPVPRWTIVLAKFAATVVVAAPLMAAVAAVITMMDPDGAGNAPLAAAVGVVVGVVAYALCVHLAGAGPRHARSGSPRLRTALGGAHHDFPERHALPEHPQLHLRHGVRDQRRVRRRPDHRDDPCSRRCGTGDGGVLPPPYGVSAGWTSSKRCLRPERLQSDARHVLN